MSRRNRQHTGRRTRSRRSLFSRRALFIATILIAALIVALVWFFNSNRVLPSEISVAEAYQKYGQEAFFLDVREQDEWDTFHIPGASLIPLGELPDRLDEVPTDRVVVVVCRSGNRSAAGRDILLDAGFTQVTSMSGGVTAWSDAGYPIDGIRP